ncbi:MAG: carbonic anhydrase, partial [Actinomycetota bacterium]
AVERVKTKHPHASRPDGLEVGREHLRDTVTELLESSELISAAIADGTLAIVGANYRLLEGTAVPDLIIGSVK